MPEDPEQETPAEQQQQVAIKKPNTALKWCLIAAGVLMLAGITVGAVAYYRLSKRVDRQLAAGALENSLSYFAAPEVLSLGDPMSAIDLAAAWKRCGFSVATKGNGLVAQSSPPVEVQFNNGQISAIVDLRNGRRLTQYQLPPQLLTNMPDEGRARRIVVRYSDLPPLLIQALTSAEDKRFFEHAGFDPLRIVKAFYVDVRAHRKEQGASTISMQLARNLWLDRDKNWKRKITEMLITMHLEATLTKQQILEDYCNTVYLGGRSTFSINGMGEAARAYFNKDVHSLTLTEAATLSGLIQRPSYFNPFRYPDRALQRRNTVLMLMRDNKYISEAQYQAAIMAPLDLSPGKVEFAESQYFLDVASDDAAKKLEDQYPVGSGRVDTTIDLRLERAAEKAIVDGMQLIDKQLSSRLKKAKARPQVALIALDPHTGEVKALCGGRDYADSQLDRVFSKRPPGSVFKPFVYTAALNTAIEGGNKILTQASIVDDSPATFVYQHQSYSPNNFNDDFRGPVTLREALAHSLNVATVKVGEMVGFDAVVNLARQAGMNEDIQPTPAVALGAYQVTPFEIARAYTIFANQGVRVQPIFVSDIRDQGGVTVYDHEPRTRRVLDPRIAFLMVDMLQEVLRSGTAAGVRARGFKLPAAGKTGTSHDGWFAGFTSQLLTVVWVGYDDYTELGLEGARSALPIWTEFMMEAARYKQFGDATPFSPPPGVVRADADCSPVGNPYFISGTQPAVQCSPEEVEITSTPDGGVTERQSPVAPPDHSTAERSITVEVPVSPQPPAPPLVAPPEPDPPSPPQ